MGRAAKQKRNQKLGEDTLRHLLGSLGASLKMCEGSAELAGQCLAGATGEADITPQEALDVRAQLVTIKASVTAAKGQLARMRQVYLGETV